MAESQPVVSAATRGSGSDGLRVLRIAHSGVVSAWRQRERQLVDLGVDLTMVSAKIWDEGGTMTPLEAASEPFVVGVGTLGRRPNLFAYHPRALWQLLGSDWDVVDIHEEPCSLATAEILLFRMARRCRAPYILYSAQNIYKRYPIPFRWSERLALAHAGAVSVCNQAAARILRAKGLSGVTAVIPLGVDVNHFAPKDRAAPDAKLKVGYVGRLAAHKGVNVLIDSMAGEADWTLSIAGAGPEEAALRARVEALELGDRVSFDGPIDQEHLPDHYRTLDVLAVPSIPVPGWEEQFCRVAVEAMSSGVPVVASRSGALPEVIGEAGLLVEPDDATDLHRALKKLSHEAKVWERLRQAGLARSKTYAWESVAAAYLDLYRRVAPPRPTPLGIATEVPEDKPPELQVVVVAYGDPRPLDQCLSALDGSLPIVVVDNSSSTEARAVVESHGATYIDPGSNLGFAAGVNRALSSPGVRGSDVLLLNPDAVIDSAGVGRLWAALRADPRLACVAPAQRTADDPASAKVSWPLPTPGRAWLDAIGLGRVGGRATFVIGSVLLLRSEAIEEIGRLDERFFLYGEEADWQMRAQRYGWRSGLAGEVVALHAGAGTGGDPIRRETHFHASHERLIRKHYGARGWALCRAGCLFGAALRSVAPSGPRRQSARLRFRLYWQGPVRAESRLRTTQAIDQQ